MFSIICGLIAVLAIAFILIIVKIVIAAIKEMSRKTQVREETLEYSRILRNN